jgi:hypothetical protein
MADSSGKSWRELQAGVVLPVGPVPVGELSGVARAALDDFGLFRRRYLGRVSVAWQEDAAVRMVGLLGSGRREFVVVNCPPGSGKSTLFTHDIPVWLTVRDRSLRGLVGSRTFRQAESYTGRLRRTLQRRSPVEAKSHELESGLAFDAEAALAVEFGPFRPDNPDIWKRDQFTVLQVRETPTDEKESTWTAFGMDSGQLGWRVNFLVWDDLVDRVTTRTAEAIEGLESWWEDEAETRLEPGGVLVLQGQRLRSNDLYRHCLDMVTAEVDDEGEPGPSSVGRKYHHIVYRAHDDEGCEGEHGRGARAQPEGCLLDPVRLPWRELATIKRNRGSKYETLYQQRDVDPDDVLVPALWVSGGRGEDGVEHPGCWDAWRGLCELPKGLEPPLISAASADPSPSKFWSVQWWVAQPSTGQRWLMDLLRQRMDAPDFLDWYDSTRSFGGVMQSWQERSVALGVPITHWVVERNAAQRFLLQYDHVRRWQRFHAVEIIGHDTGMNKSSEEFGVQMLKNLWRFGQVRLPGRNDARHVSLKLVDEVTRWPNGGSDDCVMAEWFFEFRLPQLSDQLGCDVPAEPTPEWMSKLVEPDLLGV